MMDPNWKSEIMARVSKEKPPYSPKDEFVKEYANKVKAQKKRKKADSKKRSDASKKRASSYFGNPDFSKIKTKPRKFSFF